MTNRNEHHEQTPQAGDVPRRIVAWSIVAGDSRCAYYYAGIEERCRNDAVVFSWREHGGEWQTVEMCQEHVRAEIQEAPDA